VKKQLIFSEIIIQYKYKSENIYENIRPILRSNQTS